MVLVLVVLLALLRVSNEQVYLVGPTKTIPQHFPYHAYVKSDLYCLGALISSRYVLVNAICIETRNKATAYLGTRQDPYYFGNDQGQVIRSTELITHPQFSKRYNDKLIVHNIGLVKLLDPVLLTATVSPIKLPQRQDFPLGPGTLLNITGYLDSLFDSNDLHFMTVRVKPQKDCYMYFGKSIMEDDEQCVEGVGDDRLDWPGPLVRDGVLVGLARVLSREATCTVSSPPCSPHDVFLTLGPYIDWIYENTDIPRPATEKPSITTVESPPNEVIYRFEQSVPPVPILNPVFFPPPAPSVNVISPQGRSVNVIPPPAASVNFIPPQGPSVNVFPPPYNQFSSPKINNSPESRSSSSASRVKGAEK